MDNTGEETLSNKEKIMNVLRANVYADATLIQNLNFAHRQNLVNHAYDALALIREEGLKQCLMTCGVPSRHLGAIEDIENFLIVNFPEVEDMDGDDLEVEHAEVEASEYVDE